MKAIVWTRYGSPEVLDYRVVEKPAPKPDEVLIRIHATTVTAGDCEMRSLSFPIYLGLPIRLWLGVLKPRGTTIPGTEFAGIVESVGEEIKRFKPGDRVFGATGMGLGTNAEYRSIGEEGDDMNGAVAAMPANMTFDQAATVPFGGRDALHFIRKAGLQPGHRILINGAGGSIGTFAVQLAKLAGAEVTAVDSGAKLEMLRSLGADHVIDYTSENVGTGGATYDVIFDVVGKLRLGRSLNWMTADGVFLSANPNLSQMAEALWASVVRRRRVVLQQAAGTVEDLEYLRQLIEQGKLRTVIDRTYPLEETATAHRYVETGRKQGNVVIKVAEED